MDNRRFDSLTKSLAHGVNRREVLKGLLGLGGAGIAGGVALDGEAAAARRPAPAPKPPTCPGRQTLQGGVCTCPPDAPNKCGPDCCTGQTTDPYPRSPDHTECCDNACCDGTCYGEERCCPTNMRPGELPPTHILCEGRYGLVCVEGNCCNDSDCGDPCQICNPYTHTCEARCDIQTEVCCTEQVGPGVCVTGECCLGAPCAEGAICCQGTGQTVCVEGETCPSSCSVDADCPGCEHCSRGLCFADCDVDKICCNGICRSDSDYFACASDEDACCAIVDACCNVDGCCSGACYGGASGRDHCCNGTTQVYCQNAAGIGECCPDATTQKCCGSVGCCESSQCNENANVCCNSDQFACGTGENACCDTDAQKCCAGACIDASECCPSTDGNCCEPNCDCLDPANDGLDCNGGLTNGGGVCGCGYCVVPLDGCPCGCAGNPDCVQCDGNGGCDVINQGGPCNGGDGICSDEWCVAPPSCDEQCGDYRCGVIDGGCNCGNCPQTPAGGPQFCTDAGWCCPGTSLGTDDNCRWCGDVCPDGTECDGTQCVAD